MRILCRKTYYLDHWFTKKEKIFIKGKYYTGKYSSAQPHLSLIYSEHTWPEYKVIENRVIFVDTDDNRNIWFMKEGDKVMCKRTYNIFGNRPDVITKGKLYEVVEVLKDKYIVIITVNEDYPDCWKAPFGIVEYSPYISFYDYFYTGSELRKI